MLYNSSQVGMYAGLYFTLASLLFLAIYISISNICRYYFYTSFVVFLTPFMGFDRVFKLLKYAGTCILL